MCLNAFQRRGHPSLTCWLGVIPPYFPTSLKPYPKGGTAMEERSGSRVGDGAGARGATEQPDGPQEKTWRRQTSPKCERESPTAERSLAECPQTLKQTLKARQLLSSQTCLLPSVKPRLLPDTAAPSSCCHPLLRPQRLPCTIHPVCPMFRASLVISRSNIHH